MTEPLILEILDDAATANDAIQAITAKMAFRKYNWLRGSTITNSSGNLRGIVINGKAHSVYKVSSGIDDSLGNLMLLWTFAKQAQNDKDEIHNIYYSSDDNLTKVARYSAWVGALVGRTIWVEGAEIVDFALVVAKYTKSINPTYYVDWAFGKKDEFDQRIDRVRALLAYATHRVETYYQGDDLYFAIEVYFGGR